jgi:transposase
MVFDAHDRAFALFKGTCGRGIYDNMKTAVETICAFRKNGTAVSPIKGQQFR